MNELNMDGYLRTLVSESMLYRDLLLVAFLHQSLLVVGSQEQGVYSEVSKVFMSSVDSSKSYMLAFSSILDGVTDLGKGTNPWSPEAN